MFRHLLPSSRLHVILAVALAGRAVVAADAPAAKAVFQTDRLTSTSTPRLVKIDANIKGAKELYLVVSDEGDKSCDWADWIEPKLVMADGSTKAMMNWPKANARRLKTM